MLTARAVDVDGLNDITFLDEFNFRLAVRIWRSDLDLPSDLHGVAPQNRSITANDVRLGHDVLTLQYSRS